MGGIPAGSADGCGAVDGRGADVDDGVVITSQGGAANFRGIEAWRHEAK